MPRRFNAILKEDVQSLILACKAREYNNRQIQNVVNDHLHQYNQTVSEKYIAKILTTSKEDSYKWFQSLKNGKNDYIDEFRRRITELHTQRKDMYDYIETQKEERPDLVLGAYREIHNLTKTIIELYKMMPLLQTGRASESLNKVGSEFEDTTVKYADLSA